MLRLPGLPPAASSQAPGIDNLIGLVHVLMAVLLVGWGAYYIVTLVRFRRAAHPRADYRGARGGVVKWVEAGVVLAEVALLVGIALPIWTRVTAAPAAPADADVRVVAEQYAWNIHYPGPDGVFGRTALNLISNSNPLGLDRTNPAARDDITTINELHLPVHRRVVVRLTSKDVIHSFALPVMRVKQDAIPGYVFPVAFEPMVTGHFEIACAQLCGLGHYRMRGALVVESAADYAGWLAAQAPADSLR